MKKKLAVLLLLFLFAVSQAAFAAPVINIGNECITIKVTEGDMNYTVYDVASKFYTAPAKIDNVLYVQADRFLASLGFTVQYDRKTKTLSAALDKDSLAITADKTKAVRNGKPLLFTHPMKEVKNALMLPFEEFVKKYGFTTAYDAKTKLYTASKSVDYKLGNLFLYDSSTTGKQFVYSITKTGLAVKAYTELKIGEVYPYNKKLVVYAYNTQAKYNSLYLYEAEKFIELRTNFDLVDSYDFGGYKVFYGYNNEEKRYQLFRFDGTELKLVEGDCYSPVQTVLGDNIIVGTFNKKRRYDIKAINKDWTVRILSEGIVPGTETKHPGLTLLDTLVSGDWAYMKAVVQGDGDSVYFLAYNGKDVKWINVETNEKNLDFTHVRVCADRLYLAFDKNKDGRRELLKADTSTTAAGLDIALDKKYEITAIESYLDQLYLAAKIAKKDSNTGKEVKGSFCFNPATAEAKQLEYTQADDTATAYYPFEKSMVNNSRMYLLAGRNSPTKDLYVNYGNTWAYPVFGIVEITSVVSTPQGEFLNVKDVDSMTSRNRNTVLLLDSSLKVENVALDYTMKNHFVNGLTFLFSGTNTAPNTIAGGQKIKESVSSYSGSSKEVLTGFSTKYWAPVNGTVYVNGTEDGGSMSYAVTSKEAKPLKSGLTITKVSATGNPRLLLMAGTDKSDGREIKVLYVYDPDKKTYSLISAGISFKDIILY